MANFSNRSSRLQEVARVRDTFDRSRELISQKCYQFALRNDLSGIQNLLADKKRVRMRIDALNRFIESYKDEF